MQSQKVVPPTPYKMKPKILFILHIPPPIDGAAMIGQYIKESSLINSNFDTEYINLTSAFTLETIGKGNWNKIGIIFNILKQVYKSINTTKYDCVYMTLTAKGAGFYKDFLVVLLLKLYRLKIIYHLHNKGIEKNSRKWFNHLFYKIVFKNTKCIQLSNVLFKDLYPYINKENVYVCNNGIPNLKILDKKKTDLENTTPCRFLFLSNMMYEKGVFIYLEAAQTLKNRGYKFECHCVGGWSDITEPIFDAKVKELGLENYVLKHGQKLNNAKIDYYQQADVFVFPTFYHNECFPLVILEAMHHSLPVISTPEGAISDIIIDGETGLITPQKNITKLAEAMEFMLNHPKKRQQMGIASRKKYEEQYTLTIFEKRMLTILKSVITSDTRSN